MKSYLISLRMRTSAVISCEIDVTVRFFHFLLIAIVVLSFSCASGDYDLISSVEKPISGPFYWKASYYADKFHGRPTASGEIFNMYAMTAAHKTLPFGTRLHVTNTNNGESVIVTVNDRGPFIRGRSLDLSYGAAREIHMIRSGTATVKVMIMGRDTGYVKTVSYSASNGPFTIQVGSFREKENAKRLETSLEFAYKGVYIHKVNVRGDTYYRVCIGKFTSRNAANEMAGKLAGEGYGAMVITYDKKT